jgi:hypothetical protein
MKRPNFTPINFLNNVSEFIKANTRAFSIVLTLTLIFSNIQAQTTIDCNVILACNDGVQISLDDDCDMLLEADMILEAPAYGDVAYDISAKLPNGQSLPQVNNGLDGQGRQIKTVAINRTHIGLNLEVKVSLRGCGNSCWGYAKVEDKLPPVITSCPCEERITGFSGVLNSLDLTYDRPSAVMGCPGTPAPGVTYEVRQFAVDANGIVDISLPTAGIRFSLYQTSFNPASPCTNLLATNTNAFNSTLNAGVNYFLVISTSVAGTPPGGLSYQLYMDSAVGNVKSSAAATSTICTRACNTEAALLSQTVGNASNPPRFTDACGGTITLAKRDEVEVLSCNDRYSKIVKRVWTATDARGNVSEEKTQYFYIERTTLEEIRCPDDWIVSCGLPFAKLPNGAPDPSVSGTPSNLACQNIQFYFDDVVFDLCGAGVKVFRQWTIIDWCTGEDKICGQSIKVEDNIRPVVTCPADITAQSGVIINPAAVIPVVPGTCAATWDVIPPIAVFDCSGVTWEVSFKKADSNGNPPANAPFVKVDGATSVQGTIPAFASAINASARPWRIVGLPLGRTWLKYTVTDECGNSTDCFTEIDVVDLTPPTAICEDQTVIAIDDTGWADLYATSLDNHSNDNCGPIVKFEVRRKTTSCPGYATDLNFGPKVRFCCGDITAPTSYVTVILRVYDAAGNFNDCETTVKVQNKRPPTILCPTGRTLVCGDSRIDAWVSGTAAFDTTFFGKPTTGGVCSNQIFASRIIANNINVKCKTGTVDREWFLVADPSVRCTQRLTITSPAFSVSSVTWPGDRTIPTCDLDAATPEALNSKPSVNNLTCRDIGVSSTDQYFYNTPEACIKILRTWRVIDWCSYASNQVVAEHTQVIKLAGTGGAIFTGCTNKVFDADAGKCEKEVTLSASATDGCTDAADLKYTWSLDLGKNNTVDASGTGNSFTRTLPAGTHKVTFTVTNRCGVPSTCMYDVTIRGTKKPTPICYREVVWVMDSDGRTEIWASDFNLKSENNCGDNSKLKYSFNAAGTQPAQTFTCADIPNGQVARIPLRMYVIDENGSSDFCEVILILQDSPLTNACTDNAGLLPTVSGRIVTENNEGLDNIEVELVNMADATEIKEMTHNEGQYKFSGLDVFDPKTIQAYNNSDILNGVSTLDLVLIQRHILNIQPLNSPYKLLAADVNNSRSITASDLVSLRKVILGITNEFENNTSWRFVPTSYIFSEPTFPFDFPSKVNLDSLFEDKSNVNFTALKVGDVNGSAIANSNSNKTESRNAPALLVADYQEFSKGNVMNYQIKAGEAMDIIGSQFAIEFDSDKLALKGVQNGVLPLSSQNINSLKADQGFIFFSLDIAKGLSLNADDVLLTLNFEVLEKGNTSAIRLVQNIFNAEIYDMDANIKPLHLQTRNGYEHNAQNILYQNQPNPFKDFTNISFELAQEGDVTVRVMDVTGKVVFIQNGHYTKGYHNLTINNSQLSGSGVYYSKIEAGAFSATKKMILIE